MFRIISVFIIFFGLSLNSYGTPNHDPYELSKRCEYVVYKLENLEDLQYNSLCTSKITPSPMRLAIQFLEKNEPASAQSYLNLAVDLYNEAVSIGCVGSSTIQWAANEARSISNALSN